MRRARSVERSGGESDGRGRRGRRRGEVRTPRWTLGARGPVGVRHGMRVPESGRLGSGHPRAPRRPIDAARILKPHGAARTFDLGPIVGISCPTQ